MVSWCVSSLGVFVKQFLSSQKMMQKMAEMKQKLSRFLLWAWIQRLMSPSIMHDQQKPELMIFRTHACLTEIDSILADCHEAIVFCRLLAWLILYISFLKGPLNSKMKMSYSKCQSLWPLGSERSDKKMVTLTSLHGICKN